VNFYELLAHCLPRTVVLNVSIFVLFRADRSALRNRLAERIDETLKPEVMHYAAST
jgi:hypothetical protein